MEQRDYAKIKQASNARLFDLVDRITKVQEPAKRRVKASDKPPPRASAGSLRRRQRLRDQAQQR